MTRGGITRRGRIGLSPGARAALVCALICGAGTCSGQTSFRYFYDDAHRLFRVLDSTGNLIEYDYDRTGNITAIDRSTVTPNTLAVINMTPILTGPGRTITVYGQNFSPNAAGDLVTVNGVAETVISATATTLVVQLAAGTMSGPVSVTVNGVTATSGTLQLSASAPSVTSVYPDGGLANKTTTVAVTGTHFTGATFALPGGSQISAAVTDDSDATLQIFGQTPGNYAIVATNPSGSSSTTVSAANRFIVIPEPGGAYYSMSLLNQAWISADIPSAGNLDFAAGNTVSVLNQAWISAEIPSPGNLDFAAGNTVSVLNEAWISADIPSAGNLDFAAGLLVSVNNTAMPGGMSMIRSGRAKVLGGGSTTVPVDLASVHDGDALIVGQTVRFRLYPPAGVFPGSDFLVNGAPWRIHAPFEVVVTAPANKSSVDLQPVLYAGDGRVWRMPTKRVQILPDPGRKLSGHAINADGSPVVSTTVGIRVNGLSAEYFQADKGLASWSDLNRAPDKRSFVTALNLPDTGAVLGEDPFGTGISGAYAARFRGEILASTGGDYRFFLDAFQGARLTIDGRALIDTPAGQVSAESDAAVTLAAGWHTIEIESYHTASNPSLQLSWRQPNSDREVVRPEALSTELGRAVTDANGSFRMGIFPGILNPLDGHAIPANSQIHVVLDQFISQERPIQQ